MPKRRKHGYKVPATVRLRESAAPAMSLVRLVEAIPSGALTQTAGARRYRACLIETDRWGSSGYYSAEVVGRDGPTIFPVGTHMYADHPTNTEEVERPERSIRDLAAHIVSTPVLEADGLYADIEVFPHSVELIESIGKAIGLSIRALGTAETGTVAGRTGPVITALTEGVSVDFVTRAGAGGRLVSLLESARQQHLTEARNVGAWLESRLHLELTRLGDDMYGDGRLTREERITLSAAIGDGLTAWTARVQAEAPQLFERGVWDEPPPPTAAVEESTAPPVGASTSTGAPPAANPTQQEEPSMSGASTGVVPAQAGHTPTSPTQQPPNQDLIVAESRRQVAELQLAEANNQVARLQESLTAAQQATTVAEARADSAEQQLRAVRAQEAARSACTTALAASDLPAHAHVRVMESITRNVPVTESGVVDTAALGAAITAAIEAERTYGASWAQAGGAGIPTGLGGGTQPLAESSDAAAWERQMSDRIGRLSGTTNDTRVQ